MGLVNVKNVTNGKIGLWKLSKNDDLKFAQSICRSYHPNLKNYKSDHRRHQILASKLLANALFPNINIYQNKHGKPYLNSSSDHISITNDRDYVAFLVSSEPCGIDLQFQRKKILTISEKFCHTDDSIEKYTIERLTKIWIAKEAMYKIKGLPKILFKEHLFVNQFDKDKCVGFCTHPELKFKCTINFESFENYLLAFTSEIKSL